MAASPTSWPARTHRLEITVDDFLYIEHLQALQDRKGEAPDYG